MGRTERDVMAEEKLRNYLDNLNLSYYTERELWEIYEAVKNTVNKIEECIGGEE